jgi:hypothetical protein
MVSTTVLGAALAAVRGEMSRGRATRRIAAGAL